jgi:release factor glutamine methyltransferase
MYVPSDDTFLLADCIRQYGGRWALEIGVGSGLLLGILEKNFDYVAGSDIDLQALQYSKQRSPSALLVCCDAASAFGNNGKFDLIVSNPPYLPDDDDDDDHHHNPRDLTVHGGRKGIETVIHFISSALPLLTMDGKMLLVISSLADSSYALDNIVKEKKVHKKVVKKKRLFYETLSVIQLSI